MLHAAALAALLTLQTASGSPNPAPPAGPPSGAPVSGGATYDAGPLPTPAPGLETSAASQPTAPRGPAATPTPVPRRSTTPGPAARTSGESLLVVNKTDSSVSILDLSTGKLRATVPVDPGPHEIEVFADGRMAAVASYGTRDQPGRIVSIIDPVSAKVVSRVDVGEGSRPHAIRALPDGRLLVTAEGRRELVVVDPRTAKVTARFGTGKDVSHMVAASPDGRRAYVTSLTGGSVTVIDLVASKVVKDVPTGKGAEGLDATPDGREVWVANRDANTITVIDVKTLAPVFTIKAAEFPIRVKITPDGRRALVAFTGSGDVRVYDTATRVEAARIPIGREAVEGSENRVFQKRFGTSPAPVGLLVAPDGKRAFVSATHADVVAVIDLEKMRIDDAWTTGREPDGLAGSFSRKGAEDAPRPTPAPAAQPPRRVTPRRPG